MLLLAVFSLVTEWNFFFSLLKLHLFLFICVTTWTGNIKFYPGVYNKSSMDVAALLGHEYKPWA